MYSCQWEDINLHTCDECGYEWEQEPKITNECTDEDGNRGRQLASIICPNCQEEYGRWMN